MHCTHACKKVGLIQKSVCETERSAKVAGAVLETCVSPAFIHTRCITRYVCGEIKISINHLHISHNAS